MAESLSLDIPGYDKTPDNITNSISKTIKRVRLDPTWNYGTGALVIELEGENTLRIWDYGQACCENRYLNTDDDLSIHSGAELLKVETHDAPDIIYDERGEVHEFKFLIVTTSKGVFTIETHNEHNGYYGGFDLRARLEEAD